MITKMKKLTFLIYHRDYGTFLSRIRELGVIHVQERQQGQMDAELQDALKRRTLYKDVMKSMSFKMKTPADPAIHSELSADDLLRQYDTLNSNIQSLTQQLPAIDKEIADIRPWGDFDWSSVRRLSDVGCNIKFYSCTEREFNPQWSEDYDVVVVQKSASHINFVTVSREDVKLGIEPLKLPSESLSQLCTRREQTVAAIAAAKDELAQFCVANYNTLAHLDKELSADIDLMKVRLDGEPQAEGAVILMEGWIPADAEAGVRDYLDKGSVWYEIRDAVRGDNPPIKLKNNWWTRLYERLTAMYGMPDYNEFDPTPLIAPFFSLFFAFCLGDAGYGIVYIILGMILKKKMPAMRGIANLIISLGLFTAIFGSVLGAFFGVSLYDATWVPAGLKEFMISGKIPGTTYDKQMVLALGIGVVHTIVAMLVKALVATTRYGFKNALGEWGWFLVVSTFPIIGTVMFLQILPEDISTWTFIIVGGIAAIGIYLLNNLHRNVFINIGAGVWDTYNMATGLMGDILSYMRLYALGLAGGMLGSVFNQLAFMVQESAGGVPGWAVCCLILVFGHTFNLAMSSISAFVHPLRLNFVEYFKNSGYEGTGTMYRPFGDKEIN